MTGKSEFTPGGFMVPSGFTDDFAARVRERLENRPYYPPPTRRERIARWVGEARRRLRTAFRVIVKGYEAEEC